MSGKGAYEPPQGGEDDDVLPVASTTGSILRVAGALFGVIALAVAFLTREMWISIVSNEPVITWMAGLGGAVIFTTWLRRPPPSGTRRGPKARLRNRRTR